jgi:hypothetical protein
MARQGDNKSVYLSYKMQDSIQIKINSTGITFSEYIQGLVRNDLQIEKSVT